MGYFSLSQVTASWEKEREKKIYGLIPRRGFRSDLVTGKIPTLALCIGRNYIRIETGIGEEVVQSLRKSGYLHFSYYVIMTLRMIPVIMRFT